MRTYRVVPALVAVAVVVALGSLILWWIGAESAEPGTPADEACLLYFALMAESPQPDDLDRVALRRLLRDLHPQAEAVADRFVLLSYTSTQHDFELQVEHSDGSAFRITRAGVGDG